MGQEVGHMKMALATAKEVDYGAVVTNPADASPPAT